MAGAAILAACSAPAPVAEAATNSSAFEDVGQIGLRTIPLTVTSGKKSHRFTVEVAETFEQREKGLMYRQSLAPDRGMIFLFDPPQYVAFWMKNTLIPLDMLFVDANGRILNIIANASPLSLSPRQSVGPAAAVIEIAGGRAAELGLKAGDTVKW